MRKNVVVESDQHFGCGLALHDPRGERDDSGGVHGASSLQVILAQRNIEFWEEWAPDATQGEPFDIVLNGDGIDGRHHGTTTQWTHNLSVQRKAFQKHIKYLSGLPRVGKIYLIRGTEAHGGQSGEDEESAGDGVAVVKDKGGNASRYELRLRIGDKRGGIAHFAHTIGTASRTAYESSAVMSEMSEALVEASRWGQEAPRVIVRSHRHRNIEVRIPGKSGPIIGVVTPGWQLKTPFAYRTTGGRQAQPQIGGVLVRYHKGELFVRSQVWDLDSPEVE